MERESRLGLFLVRHGEANPKSVDPSRSLSPRGQEEAASVGSFLSSLKVKPDQIYASDKIRAIKTAAIISGFLKFDEEKIIVSDALGPEANPEDVASLLSRNDPGGTIVVVGHMPSIGRFAGHLITTGREAVVSIDFDTCGVAYLEGEDVLEPGSFVLKALVSPKII
ncbi:MAG: phosphohistidine phosphatase SixA [Deltaproteobacteria bacterium]|nr:phosphohistidine phosphatase SixA [Deltaproteobacteria bacterium]NIS78404.1 phosphohistidine phosphatase SixA [Deltaproteobacteria bacterium]